MRLIVLSFIVFLSACSTLDKRSLSLEPGMTKNQVSTILGTPANRSFREQNEAWQYQGIVGFGQCVYKTAWFTGARLVSITSRRGSSVAGCGLGSREVDWGQMPSPSLDLNVNIRDQE